MTIPQTTSGKMRIVRRVLTFLALSVTSLCADSSSTNGFILSSLPDTGLSFRAPLYTVTVFTNAGKADDFQFVAVKSWRHVVAVQITTYSTEITLKSGTRVILVDCPIQIEEEQTK